MSIVRPTSAFQPQGNFKETVLQEEFESDQHASILASNISRLRSGQYSDYTIHTGSFKKKSFPCHKIILIVSSEFFRAQITGSFLNQSGMTIKDVEPDEFEGILDYIYRGKIILTTLNVERILYASHRLLLEDLKRGCVNFLLKTLDPDNCLRYWRWAEANDLSRLKEACRTLTARDFYRVVASPDLFDLPDSVMRTILLDEDLDVQSEVDVVEVVARWLDCLARKDGTYPIQPICLLRLVRWAGVSDMYVRRKLMDDPRLMSNQPCRDFLSNVLEYLSGGSPFSGLVTIHRPLTGLEKCVIVVGVVTDNTVSSDVIRISLQRPDASIRDRIGTRMRKEAAACVCQRTNTLYISGIGEGRDEIWQLATVGGWNRCDNMKCARRRHCMVSANETSIFIIAGFAGPSCGIVSTIEKYDTRRESCVIVGDLVHPIDSAACIAHYNYLYVFGGSDKDGNPVNHVQLFDTSRNICTLLVYTLPRPAKLLRAVMFNRLVILTSLESCYLFDLDKQQWYQRHQFRSGKIHFGCVVENQKLYIIGGGNNVRDTADGQFKWILCDQIRSVAVSDILEDRPAMWLTENYRLPVPCLVQAYAPVTAAYRK